ncbi:DoxX family protein [Rhodopila sp.]|uniref:DoxX family protein n=1 Tax=Rhodopila sp. TaxID=2480087 RepID=UPI002B73D735|nr:DoxX family protein [Rhodopila sp.]HVZ07218.1 DoxX family protein [Rhodopila sp.]
MDWVSLTGRLLMSAIFIQAGFLKATTPAATMALLSKWGIPLVGAAYALTVVVELAGGLALLAGYRTRLVALILAAWCAITALKVHYHPGDQQQMIHFLKNLCMAGGLLQLVANGAGRLAVSRG